MRADKNIKTEFQTEEILGGHTNEVKIQLDKTYLAKSVHTI